MEAEAPAPAGWSRLGWELTELILSHLPLRAIVVACAVCRQWRLVVTYPSFANRAADSRPRRPWFFLYGQHNFLLRKNQGFAFDPEDGEWALLPPTPLRDELFSGSGGFCFATSSSPTRFSYAPLLRGSLSITSPLSFSRCNPLLGVFNYGGGPPRFIVVGGARFVGGLVDIEDRLAVEIYDPVADAWELCPPLPTNFRPGNSSQWLSSALIGGLFFVFGIYSGSVAAFDLGRRAWTAVRSLRPPGILFAFLLACGDRLVLAGLCAAPNGPPRFVLWTVDDRTLNFTEIGSMPRDLLSCLFDAEDEDARFASLKCVGLDGLVYVFNEDYHKAYPACVCEISTSAACNWRKLPPLPGPINRFHKVVTFCSAVPLRSVLPPAADGDVERGLLQ